MWASFFAKPGSSENEAIDKLLDIDRVALIGPIIAEVLSGFRRKDQADWIASRLRVTHYLEVSRDDWQAAADLARELASKGHKPPLTDLVIATVARRMNCFVYTTDPHFDLIADLKRYWPD